METLLLNVKGEGPDAPVIPRRLRLELKAGAGRLLLPPDPSMDGACRSSLTWAWKSACRLAGRDDVDALASIAGPAPLHGCSAGASGGLLALTALLGRAESVTAFFATGCVIDDSGMWSGGIAAARKARAAQRYASQLEMGGCPFFSPPLLDPPRVEGIQIFMATDLGSAYARLDPDGYMGIRSRHQGIRGVGLGEAGDVWDPTRPFALVSAAHAKRLPEKVGDIQIVARTTPGADDPSRVELGQARQVLWRVVCPAQQVTETGIPELFRLAREHAVT